jgi:carnitine O-acetyltransferase
MPKAKNERTSKRIGTVASKAMRDPASLTLDEIRSLGASATTQRPDRKKSKTKKPSKKAVVKVKASKQKPSKKKASKKRK